MPSENDVKKNDLAYEGNDNEERFQHRLHGNWAGAPPQYNQPIDPPMHPIDPPRRKKVKGNQHSDVLSKRHLQHAASSKCLFPPVNIRSSPSLAAPSIAQARPAPSAMKHNINERPNSSFENPYSTSRGLRHFSMKVCEKVEEKGTTTYNEVADEVRVVRCCFWCVFYSVRNASSHLRSNSLLPLLSCDSLCVK